MRSKTRRSFRRGRSVKAHTVHCIFCDLFTFWSFFFFSFVPSTLTGKMINNTQATGGVPMTEGHNADGDQIRSSAMKQPGRVVVHILGISQGTLAPALVGRFVSDQAKNAKL